MTTIDGMLPQHGCKGCGRVLNKDGYHPAELYAGTAEARNEDVW